VNEVLQFDGGLGSDGGNLRQAQFPGQHGAGKAQAFQHPNAGGIVYRHLGGGVQFESGKMLPRQAPDGQILKDDGVDAHALESAQGIDELGKLLLFDQSVEGDIDFAVQGMGIAQHSLHVAQREIFGLGPRGEIL